MALATAFQELGTKLAALRDALRDLRVSTVEDRPLRGDVLLADQFGETAEDLRGWVTEAWDAAQSAQRAVAHPADFIATRQALIQCQERFSEFTQRFATELAHYERLAELARLGQERRGEWRAWTSVVSDNIERCRSQQDVITQALFQCWQELAEQAAQGAVFLHTTNIGQQHNNAPEWPTRLREFT